jgi:GNAT superfamily N-acetyltransferase
MAITAHHDQVVETNHTVGVRRYAPADREAVRDISFMTGLMGEPVGAFWRHRESWADVWTSYYTDREPGSLFVATIGDDVVGYLAGCVDTATMRPTTDERLVAAIRRHWLFFRPGTAGFLIRAMLDGIRDEGGARGELVDPRWPAHLHIDLLPVARGIGLGRALMEPWLRQLSDVGSPGCHLATLSENSRAHAFFERAGFRDHGAPSRVPGMRGKRGEHLHQQFMVRDIDDPARPAGGRSPDVVLVGA